MSSSVGLQSALDACTAAEGLIPRGPAGDGKLLAQSLILSAEEMRQPVEHRIASGSIAVFTGPSPNKTTVNEDVVALVPLGPKQAVLAVADGLGGHASGEDAARLAATKLATSLESAKSRGEVDELRPAILDGFESANQAVRALGNGRASTLAVAEINAGVVRTYHVGDSAIMLIGGRGRIKLQTISHSPIGYAVESGIMDEAEAIHHEDRHVISNVIGASDMRIEIGPPLRLAPRDTLVLASDGLFDNLLLNEIVDLVRTGPVIQGVSRLASRALSRMTDPSDNAPSKPDDMAIITFRLG